MWSAVRVVTRLFVSLLHNRNITVLTRHTFLFVALLLSQGNAAKLDQDALAALLTPIQIEQ